MALSYRTEPFGKLLVQLGYNYISVELLFFFTHYSKLLHSSSDLQMLNLQIKLDYGYASLFPFGVKILRRVGLITKTVLI